MNPEHWTWTPKQYEHYFASALSFQMSPSVSVVLSWQLQWPFNRAFLRHCSPKVHKCSDTLATCSGLLNRCSGVMYQVSDILVHVTNCMVPMVHVDQIPGTTGNTQMVPLTPVIWSGVQILWASLRMLWTLCTEHWTRTLNILSGVHPQPWPRICHQLLLCGDPSVWPLTRLFLNNVHWMWTSVQIHWTTVQACTCSGTRVPSVWHPGTCYQVHCTTYIRYHAPGARHMVPCTPTFWTSYHGPKKLSYDLNIEQSEQLSAQASGALLSLSGDPMLLTSLCALLSYPRLNP